LRAIYFLWSSKVYNEGLKPNMLIWAKYQSIYFACIFFQKKLWIRPRSAFSKKFPETVASLAKNKDYDSLVFNIYLKKRVLFDLLPFNNVRRRKTFEDRNLRDWASIINLALLNFCQTKYKFFCTNVSSHFPPTPFPDLL